MGHHLTAFIGSERVLQTLKVKGLRLLQLQQGIWLAPMPDCVIANHNDDNELSDDEVLDSLAKKASHTGPIGWLISDWFGGVGDTRVGFWDGGRPVAATQDEMLARLGVVRVTPGEPRSKIIKWLERVVGIPQPRPLDEWDSLGLGNWRSTERAYEAATEYGEILIDTQGESS